MWQSSVLNLQWSISLWVATSAWSIMESPFALEAEKPSLTDTEDVKLDPWNFIEVVHEGPLETAVQQHADPVQPAVDVTLVSAKPQVQTDFKQAAPVKGNNEGEAGENFTNLFNAHSSGNRENGMNRDNLKAKVAQERHVFNGMNKELRFNLETADRRRHPFRNVVFSAETSVVKRAIELVKPEERPAKLAKIKADWEAAYAEMKRARNETDILRTTKAFRATCPNDALFMEPNNMYSDLALYLCALTVSRMCIEDAYVKEVRPNSTAAPSSADRDALVKDWRTYFDTEKNNDTFAGRVREAYFYLKPFNDEYATNFTQSVVRLAELCRQYEAKIPELQAQFDRQIAKDGTRIGLSHTLINDTNWNMNFDDVYVINRIRHAQNLPKIAWLWLNIDEKTVMPFCANHGY